MVSHFLLEYGQWNRTLLAQIVPDSIVEIISKLFIPANDMPDKMFWALSADGEYSVKSGVALLQGYGLQPPPQAPFRWIWQVDIPPKIKFFFMESLPEWASYKEKIRV